MKKLLILSFLCLVTFTSEMLSASSGEKNTVAPGTEFGARQIPARTIPVPSDVSPELSEIISRPLNPNLNLTPGSSEEWRELVRKASESDVEKYAALRQRFPVDVEGISLGDIKAHLVTPKLLPKENSDRILFHLHGGGYVFNGGEAGAGEAVLMAYHGKYRVISIDYRMAPDHPYPAALEDAVNAYLEIIKKYSPGKVAIFGTSAGGGLSAATVLKLIEIGAPLPGAVGLGTPWADLTKTGDTLSTNEFIDNVLVSYNGMLKSCANLYAGSHDMKDKFISPVYGDYTRQFPPTIFTTGTRDLFLSDTARLERKLRLAGVETRMQVIEGMSHAQYIMGWSAPESTEAFEVIGKFFDKHLER